MRQKWKVQWITLAVAVAATAAGAAEFTPASEVRSSALGAGVSIEAVAAGTVRLSVTGPQGLAWQGQGAGSVQFGAAEWGASLPDGLYRWELREQAPRLERGVTAERAEVPLLASGIFRVVDGAVVLPNPDLVEPRGEVAKALPAEKTTISGDLTVYNSLCVGFDCLANESYGSDTIRLKENNLRIHFDDTSAAAGFPNRDWRIIANDTASGGANKFSIEDSTGGRTPFTIEAGAPSHSLYVDDAGRVGFGTSTPVVELHSSNGDTPTLRLEQNGSSGFSPQTWDVAGNETSFFVRDATNGSTLPFRIRPGAASNSLVIANDSNVGVGILSPTQKLEVSGGDIKVARSTGTTTTSFFFENTAGGVPASWILRANGTNGAFTFTEAGGNTAFKINTGAITNGITITNTGVDLQGTLRVGGVVVNVPDYVFDPAYDLPSIEQQAEHMYTNKHLPAVPKETLGEDGRPMVDLVAYQLGMLEELEKAHVYIAQLHQTLKGKDQRLDDLEARLAALEAESQD